MNNSIIAQALASGEYHYAVQDVTVTNKQGVGTVYPMIVIKDDDHLIVGYTGLGQLVQKYTGHKPIARPKTRREMIWVCHALNYLITNYDISSWAEVTSDMLDDCFEAYQTKPKYKNDAYDPPSQASLDGYIRSVTYFFGNIYYLYGISTEDILEPYFQRDSPKSSKEIRCYRPIYRAKALTDGQETQLRDLPDDAVLLLLEVAAKLDPLLVFPIFAQLVTGLRPGEAMNLRAPESPVSPVPGIKFTWIGNAINSIEIDLTRHYILRADGKSTGGIKRKRTVVIPKPYRNNFYQAFRWHMELLKKNGLEPDPEYLPLNVNRNGEAMTYAGYRDRFQHLVSQYLVPELLKAEDPKLKLLGMLVNTGRLNPHVLRHVFTVNLVKMDYSVADIKYYRGDRSPESANTYMANKSELLGIGKKAHGDFLADNLFGERGRICQFVSL